MSGPPIPPRAVRYASIVGVAGTLAFAWAAVALLRAPTRSTLIWVGLTVVLVGMTHHGFSLSRFRRKRSEIITHDEILFPLLLMVLGPAGVVVAWTLGILVSDVLVRRSPLKVIFNVGQTAIAAGMGALVFAAGGSDVSTGRGLLAVTVASFVFAAAMPGVFAQLLSLLEDGSWLTQMRVLLHDDGPKMAVETTLGLMLGVAVVERPVLVVLAIPTALVVLHYFRRWFGTRRERALLADVLEASTAIHRAPTQTAAEEALTEAVFTLTGAEASVNDHPTNDPDTAAVFAIDLPDTNTRHLAITRRVPSLEADEIAIIETLVEIARTTITSLALSEELLASSEQLRSLLEMKDRFLSTAAHAIRTPLTAIGGFASLASGSGLDEADRREMMKHITTQVNEMSMLVDNLLIATRSDTGQVGVASKVIDLGTEIRKLLDALEAGYRVELQAAPESRAFADPVRTRQLLRNLITNALAHGGERVEVQVSSSHDRVTVEVRDDGEGIPDFETIVEPMERSQPGSDTEGLGLGLHVAHILAELMGGRLTYRRYRRWTVLRLSLPRVDQSIDQAASLPG